MFPEDLQYSRDHLWIKTESPRHGRIGITFYAQKQLGDVVYVDLPTLGDRVSRGDDFAVIESIKAVSDIFSPLSGIVVEVNEALIHRPELVNESPYGDGWLAIIQYENDADSNAFMPAQAYRKFVEAS